MYPVEQEVFEFQWPQTLILVVARQALQLVISGDALFEEDLLTAEEKLGVLQQLEEGLPLDEQEKAVGIQIPGCLEGMSTVALEMLVETI